jgi:hypothetical protein
MSADHMHMSKGVTFSDAEMREIVKAIEGRF